MGSALQWGVVRVGGGAPQPALRDGDQVVLAGELALGDVSAALRAPDLNALIELGPDAWRAVRDGAADAPAAARVALADCEPVMPVHVTDYADFYASLAHATNFGSVFRPGQPPVRENWHHIPVGYHGRASTFVVSGTAVRRPRGPLGPGVLGRTGQLDLECELGYVCGPTRAGPIPIDEAPEHIFGVVLLNDWSARDIQHFESEPLGPFLGKSFATSISAWITPLDALADARVAPEPHETPLAPYLTASDPWLLDVALEIELNGEVISRPQAAGLYWTPAQMLAHLAVNGAVITAGDVFASGTVSGFEDGTQGTLAELYRGERWLADGDEVVFRGRAGDVELGELRGHVLPAD
jgi:fumarylacetoacetase